MTPIKLKWGKIVRNLSVRGVEIDYYREQFPLFHGVALTVVRCEDIMALHGLEIDNCEMSPTGITEAMAFYNTGTANVVLLLKPNATPGTIAHEALHAVFAMGKITGLYPDNNSEEAFAYAIGWVVNKAHDLLSV
jgi:hypothetical protein